TDWKTIELKKTDSGFGALIPCKDATQGRMQYYVQGFNGQNDPVATSGTRGKPFTVPVTAQIIGPNPSLPGEEPPEQCADTGECPPGFPECAGKKAEGDECDADEDCDSDRCKQNKCASSAASSKAPKVWFGLGVQADWYALPGATDVCVVNPPAPNPYVCVDPGSGTAFPNSGLAAAKNRPAVSPATLNKDIVRGQGDQVVAGFKLANVRIFLSLDYAVSHNVLIGVRGGYVFNTDPSASAFAPIHLEARLTYVFGKDAVSTKGISPMIFGGVGAGEFDAFVPVTVTLANLGLSPGTENAWL